MKTRSRSWFVTFTCGLSLLAFLPAPVAQAQAAAATTASAPFTEAKFDDIVGDVTVVPSTSPTNKLPAKLNEIFKAPDTLITGRRSRAQLKAADGTIARVGSQTAFSLEANSRTVHLQQGSILFNSPKGMGGGTIVTNAATATVLGTTIIVTATSNGGFKILVLEGHASVTYPGGQTVNLGPGQMTFVLPGTNGGGAAGGGTTGGGATGGTPGPVLNFDLERQLSGANLINGFTITLPSDNLILDAARGQQILIKNGELTQTNKAIVGAISSTQVILVDQSTITSAIDAARQQDNTPAGDARLAAALASTLTLATETEIPDLNIFLDPTNVTASQLGIADGLIGNNALTITGAIAGDIFASGNVDLSQLTGLPQISLLAGNQNTFTFTGDTSFGVPRGTYEFNLYSAGSFVIPEDIFIEAYALNGFGIVPLQNNPGFTFRLGSAGAMAITNDTIENFGGNLSLNTLTGNLDVNDSAVRATTFSNSRIELTSRNASVSVVNDSEIVAGSRGIIYFKAGGQLNIDNTNLLFGGEGSAVGNEVDAYAIGNASVTNTLANASVTQVFGGQRATFASSTIADNDDEQSLQVGAKTVVLSDVDLPFGSSMGLYSATGHLSVLSANSTPVEGDINFIGNVTIDGDPASGFGDEIVHLGITADNTDVQAALASTLSLPTLTFPDSLSFKEVMFTPANIAHYYSGGAHEPFLFEGGIIVGTLNINGDSLIDEVDNVTVNNLNINSSAELNVADTSELNLYFLGNITNPNNTELDVHFVNPEGLGTLSLEGLGPLKLSHLNLFTDNAEIDLYGGSDSDLGISLDTVHLETSQGDLYFDEFGGGSISIVNSTLDAAVEDSGQISLRTDYAGGITIGNSHLTADGEINLYTGEENRSGPNTITITGSDLTSHDFIGIYAGDSGRDDIGLVNITSSNLTAPSMIIDGSFLSFNNSTLVSNDGETSIDAYNTLTIANSAFDALEGYSFGAYGLTISNSTFTSDDNNFEVNNYSSFRPFSITNTTIHVSDGIDIQSDDGAALNVVSSNLTTSSSIDIEAAFRGSIIENFGDLLVQSSSIDATDDGVLLAGGTSLAVVNSTIKGEDGSVELEGGAITVQDSILQSGPSNGAGGEISIVGDSVVTVVNSKLIAQNVDVHTSPASNTTINLNTVNLDAATTINIAARTVNLSNINFPGGSNVTLGSQNGLLAPNPNTNAQPVFGYVNFITNVNYGGQPAQNFVPIAVGGSSTNPNAPIQITQFPGR